MRGLDGIGNWVLLIMAAASLVSMIAALCVNDIISHDLTSYGLRFSYGWAIPYWNAIGTVFAMAWLSIIVAIAFQIYRIRTIRKDERQSVKEQFENALRLRDYQENGYYEDGDRRNYGIKIVTDQTETQEAKEQIQIVPYEPVAPPQIESSPEKTED